MAFTVFMIALRRKFLLFKQEVQMWKLLFPGWFIVVGFLGVILMASATVIFWLMLGYLPVPSGRIFPRGIGLPVLIGIAGALLLLLAIINWFWFALVPLLKLIVINGWKVGILKYTKE